MNITAEDIKRQQAADKARQMRYRRPMLADLGWSEMQCLLYDIAEQCSEVHYFCSDWDNLLAAFDGDDDAANDFTIAYSELEADVERLNEVLNQIERLSDEDGAEDYYNNCTVALIGNRYELFGFDQMDEDYCSLCGYDTELAVSEAGKKLMRYTKAEIISRIGQCMGALLAFADIRSRYEHLEATMDILCGYNQAVRDAMEEINKLYEASTDGWYDRRFDELLKVIPDEVWLY